MSRTINLQLPEGDVRARCHESGVSLTAIETLQSGETHLVCKTADGADEMRLRLSDHVIHGTVRRFAFMAREIPGDDSSCSAHDNGEQSDFGP